MKDSNMYTSFDKEVYRDKNMYDIVLLNSRVLDVGGGKAELECF